MPRIPICVDNRPRIRFAHPINAWTIVAAHPRIRCAAHPIRVDNRSRIRIGCGADFLHISNPDPRAYLLTRATFRNLKNTV